MRDEQAVESPTLGDRQDRETDTELLGPTKADQERFEKFTREAIARYPQPSLRPSIADLLSSESALLAEGGDHRNAL